MSTWHRLENIQGKLGIQESIKSWTGYEVENPSIPGLWKLTTIFQADRDIASIFNSKFPVDNIQVITSDSYTISKPTVLPIGKDTGFRGIWSAQESSYEIDEERKAFIVNEELNKHRVKYLAALFGYQILDISTIAKIYGGNILAIVTSSEQDGIIAHVKTLEDVTKQLEKATCSVTNLPYENLMIKISRTEENGSDIYKVDQKIEIPNNLSTDDEVAIVAGFSEPCTTPFPEGFEINGKKYFNLKLISQLKVDGKKYQYNANLFDSSGNPVKYDLDTTNDSQLVAKHLHENNLLKKELQEQYKNKHCEALYSYFFVPLR